MDQTTTDRRLAIAAHEGQAETGPSRVLFVSDAEDICARLERMKKLCDELDTAQRDSRKCQTLIERARADAAAFGQRLGTHDPQP